MRVEVVELRSQGRKLPKDELEGPITGCLVIDSWTLSMGADGKRMVREASLHRTYFKGEPALLASLQDAQVTRADERGMVIIGMQRRGENQYQQAWWVRPII